MGPLKGFRVIELVGLGPGPFCGMLLADMGAEVIRIDRPGGAALSMGGRPELDFLNRSKRSIGVDLKRPEGAEVVLKLLESADALIEGYRPGVTEKLGLGPEDCRARNPRLVYGRMTGWGQEGPLAPRAGHDINYVALSGALHGMGRAGEKPAIPLNLVGDFGGGGLMLAFGIVSALLEASRSGKGQVVDTAMIDGAATLMAAVFGAFQSGFWSDTRGTNMLDGGAFFYEVYETADGKYVSIGSIEPQFYARLLEKTGLADEAAPEQWAMAGWPEQKERFAGIFRQKTRDEWCALMEDEDICFAPVLSMEEVRHHRHHQARGTFVDNGKIWQPAPAPRFSRSGQAAPVSAVVPGTHTHEVLEQAGFAPAEIDGLLASGAVATASVPRHS